MINTSTLNSDWHIKHNHTFPFSQGDASLGVTDSTYLYRLGLDRLNSTARMIFMTMDKSTGSVVKIYIDDSTTLPFQSLNSLDLTSDGNAYGIFQASSPLKSYIFHYSVSNSAFTIYELTNKYYGHTSSSLNAW